jgi:hypothetical protein
MGHAAGSVSEKDMSKMRLTLAGVVLVAGLLAWIALRSSPVQPLPAATDPPIVSAAPPESADLKIELATARARIANLETQVRDLTAQLEEARPKAPVARSQSQGRRGWGPEQAIGVPDTLVAGDFQTAWATRDPDAGPEWLVVDFPKEVDIAQVRVRETLGPGTIFMVSAITADGAEKILWHGTEPEAEAPVEMEFNPSIQVRSRRIRIQLNTALVKGWNEIDAVELIGSDGSRQWASAAWASSTYADRMGGLSEPGLSSGLRPMSDLELWREARRGVGSSTFEVVKPQPTKPSE